MPTVPVYEVPRSSDGAPEVHLARMAGDEALVLSLPPGVTARQVRRALAAAGLRDAWPLERHPIKDGGARDGR